MGLPARPNQSEAIRDLKVLIGAREGFAERERYPFSLYKRGIPRGALIEMAGPGKTETLVQFLKENPQVKIAWVEEELSINPVALVQKNLNLSRFLFVEGRVDFLWTIFQVLKSHLFQCIVVPTSQKIDERNLRRLQLETEKGHACVFLLSEKTHRAWPISLQFKVSRNDSHLHFHTLREKI